MEKLSTEYEFDVTRHSVGGITITLTQVETGKVKVFRQAMGNVDRLYDHMCSLTDSQCEQWFNAGDRKKNPKKNRSEVTPSVQSPTNNQA